MKKTPKNLCDPNIFKTQVPPQGETERSPGSEQDDPRRVQGHKPRRPSSPSKRVLMMVDEGEGDALGLSLQDGLRGGDVEVDICADLRQTLERFKDNDYDLVLLDLQSQVLDGFRVCRELKRIRGDARMGFLTAFPIYKTEFDRLFPDIGVELFYTKSTPAPALTASIRREVERRQRRDLEGHPSSAHIATGVRTELALQTDRPERSGPAGGTP